MTEHIPIRSDDLSLYATAQMKPETWYFVHKTFGSFVGVSLNTGVEAGLMDQRTASAATQLTNHVPDWMWALINGRPKKLIKEGGQWSFYDRNRTKYYLYRNEAAVQ